MDANPHAAPCDSCEAPVDLNGYDYKLVTPFGRELLICRPCVEQSPEDWGY
jgi:hypothetical protein